MPFSIFFSETLDRYSGQALLLLDSSFTNSCRICVYLVKWSFVGSFGWVNHFALSSDLYRAHDILINLGFRFALYFARVFRLLRASALRQNLPNCSGWARYELACVTLAVRREMGRIDFRTKALFSSRIIFKGLPFTPPLSGCPSRSFTIMHVCKNRGRQIFLSLSFIDLVSNLLRNEAKTYRSSPKD